MTTKTFRGNLAPAAQREEARHVHHTQGRPDRLVDAHLSVNDKLALEEIHAQRYHLMAFVCDALADSGVDRDTLAARAHQLLQECRGEAHRV